MFSSVGTANSRHSQAAFAKVSPISIILYAWCRSIIPLQSYASQVPKGFSVRVFKGPTLSSFPHTATAKFDLGYHTIPLAEPRQNSHWYPSRSQNTSKSYSAPSEPPKASRSQTTDSSATTFNRGYENNARPTAPSYSIYQSSKDTYVYEPSLSSKSDLYSNTEYDGASTVTSSPSSLFSPAMSTDSLTTFKSPITPETSLGDRDSRSSTPTPLRNSFIPGLSQAQSAIRGIFRSQTPHESQPSSLDGSYIPHAPSTRHTPLPSPQDDAHLRNGTPSLSRSTTPIRLSSVSSGSADRTPHTASSYSTPSSAEHFSHSYAPSTASETERSELDRVARTNAEYNASSSTSSSAYYSTRRESVLVPAPFPGAPNLAGVPRQFYPNVPLRSSPEQQHAFSSDPTPHSGDSSRETSSSYFPTTDTASRNAEAPSRPAQTFQYAPSDSEDAISAHSEQFIPPLAAWVDGMENRQTSPRHQSDERPSRHQHEEYLSPPIPQFLNEGPPQSRYVPASRTMAPNVQASLSSSISSLDASATAKERDYRQDRPLPVPPPTQPWNSQRERRPSLSHPRVNSASSLSHDSREGNDSAPRASHMATDRSTEAPRRSPVEQRSFPTAREPDHPVGRDYRPIDPSTDRLPHGTNHPSFGIPPVKASPEQDHHRHSVHQATLRDHAPSASFGGSASTIPNPPPNRVNPPLRTSPEQMQRVPSGIYAAASSNRSPNQNRPSAAAFEGDMSGIPNPPLARVFPTLQTSPVQEQRGSVAQSHGDHRSLNPTSQRNGHSDVRNSPPRSQPTVSGPRDHQPHATESFVDHSTRGSNGLASQPIYPTYPSPTTGSLPQRYPSSNGTSGERPRLSSDPRAFDFTTTQRVVPPPSVSSDPGQGRDHRRISFLEPQRGGGTSYPEARTSYPPLSSPAEMSSVASATLAGDAVRSRTHYTDPRSEPRRRHSDGERSVNSSSSYAPNHSTYAAPAAGQAPAVSVEPHRRFSDGDQVVQPNTTGGNSVTLFRTVRWNENLVCPSPIFASQRRKGWFNRRG